MKENIIIKNSPLLRWESFLEVIEAVGWVDKDKWSISQVETALSKVTAHYTAWSEGTLIGIVRVLSGGLIFTCIPEILIVPKFQTQGIGIKLMKIVIEDFGETIIFLGAQPGNDIFFEKLGFKKGPQSYEKCFRPRVSNKV